MNTNFSYENQEKLKNLSKQLSLLRAENSFLQHIDQKITSENLKYNLALLISKIILKSKVVLISETDLEAVIVNYNQAHGTNLTVKNYYDLTWVRKINEEIRLPRVVGHFLWKIGYNQSNGKPFVIPQDKQDLIQCLHQFYLSHIQNKRKTISALILADIIKEHSITEITIEYLENNEIIKFDSKQGDYALAAQDHKRFLKNEIASLIWQQLCGETTEIDTFRKYVRYLNCFGIWPDNLPYFLSYKQRENLVALSIELINSEEDIKASSLEFNKIWLDTPSYSHIELTHSIPVLEFDTTSTYELIKSRQQHKFRFRESFDYQETRYLFALLIKLILQCDGQGNDPYDKVIKLLSNSNHPFIVWTLYSEIGDRYTEVIPFILQYLELSPIAFKLLSKLKLNSSFINAELRSEDYFREVFALKNSIWLYSFEILLDQLSTQERDMAKTGEIIAQILDDTSYEVFKNKTSQGTQEHEGDKFRYAQALERLKKQRVRVENVFPTPKMKARLFPYILKYIFNHLKTLEREVHQSEYLSQDTHLIDLMIEILRISNISILEDEVNAELINEVKQLRQELTDYLLEKVSGYFTIQNIKVINYDQGGFDYKKAKYGLNDFGREIIDWAYLFLHLGEYRKLEKLDQTFSENIAIENTSPEGKYSDQNREQEEKIKFYLQILLMAYLGLSKQRLQLEIEGFEVKQTINSIEQLISKHAVKYSKEDLSHQQLNVFDEWLVSYEKNIYYQSLNSLLYKCVNLFPIGEQKLFIENYFHNSSDLGKMLTAINLLESKTAQDAVANKIQEIDVEKFISSKFTVTDLETALIEAINSEAHWEKFTQPLLSRIEKHYKKYPYDKAEKESLLFKVKLLQAFKMKDPDSLKKLEIPSSEYGVQNGLNTLNTTKQYYIALSYLYHEDKPEEAITELESLLSHDFKDVYVSFHLYRARTQLALREKNIIAMRKAHQEWEAFIDQLKEKEKINSLVEPITFISIQHYAAEKDYARFDKSLNSLSDKNLYDEDLISLIYNIYVERGLHELAFSFVRQAVFYRIEHGLEISYEIEKLNEGAETEHLLMSVRNSLKHVRNITPSNLVKIVPEILNDKRKLSEFILYELIQASRVLLDKIHSVAQIVHEDRYNDLLLAILRLRFPIWGWSLHDQSPTGVSPSGIRPGEVDIFIQAAGNNIALIEALILSGGNKSLLEKHILKCDLYCSYLNRFYIITYFKGDKAKFDSTWETYEKDIFRIAYPPSIELNTKAGFEDLSDKFPDCRHLKIARTIHAKTIEFFHIMLDLSN